MNSINKYGILLTEEDVDILNDHICSLESEDIQFDDAYAFLKYLRAKSLANMNGEILDIETEKPIPLDGDLSIEDIPYAYLVPLTHQPTLFSEQKYKSTADIYVEIDGRFKEFSELLPDGFDLKKRLVHLVGVYEN